MTAYEIARKINHSPNSVRKYATDKLNIVLPNSSQHPLTHLHMKQLKHSLSEEKNYYLNLPLQVSTFFPKNIFQSSTNHQS